MPQGQAQQHIRLLRTLAAFSVVLPVAVICLFGVYKSHQLQAEAGRQVERSSRVVHENAVKVVLAAESAARRASALVEGKSSSDILAGQARLREELADIARDQSQLLAITVVTPDGKIAATSRPGPMPDITVGDREYFKAHVARPAGGLFLSAPMVSRASGERVMDLSSGFGGAGGGFGGVVDVSIKTSYFAELYSDLATGNPGLALAAFSGGGDIYARWPPALGVLQLNRRSSMMLEIASGKDAGGLRGASPVDGQDKMMRYRRVGQYPLYTAAGVSLSDLQAALVKDMAVLLALGIPPIVALWFALRAAWRRAQESADALRRLDEETAARMRAESSLAQAQRLEALGRVAGGVAHEFNNALMVVGTNAHLIERSGAEAIPKRVQSIKRAVESATKLTRQLLSFTKRQALAPELVDLREFLPGLAPLLSPILGSKIDLAIDVASATPPIRVDPAELELALVNLAINARDAMPKGGSFALSARTGGDDFAVSIVASDTGEGIDATIADKVFEPFFTTKEVGVGTGLGLSQVHSMCLRAGGAARIAPRDGPGASISLLFPRALPAVAEISEDDGAPLNKRVLLVEDDPAVAEATLALLTEIGCESHWVDRASAAIDWLSGSPGAMPDLVVSDVRMPGELDGLGLARRLRSERPRLALLLVTGYAEGMPEIEAEGFPSLPKPFDAVALRAALKRLAERPRQT